MSKKMISRDALISLTKHLYESSRIFPLDLEGQTLPFMDAVRSGHLEAHEKIKSNCMIAFSKTISRELGMSEKCLECGVDNSTSDILFDYCNSCLKGVK